MSKCIQSLSHIYIYIYIFLLLLTPVHSCETTTPSIHGNTSLLEPKQNRPRDAFTAFLTAEFLLYLVSDSVWFTFIYHFPKAEMEVETARPYFFGDIGKSTGICRVVRTAAACCHILIVIFHTIVLFLMSCSCSQQPMNINMSYMTMKIININVSMAHVHYLILLTYMVYETYNFICFVLTRRLI